MEQQAVLVGNHVHRNDEEKGLMCMACKMKEARRQSLEEVWCFPTLERKTDQFQQSRYTKTLAILFYDSLHIFKISVYMLEFCRVSQNCTN